MADTVGTLQPIKFGYTDKTALPASFTQEYKSYIVFNTTRNSVMFSDNGVTGEISALGSTKVTSITGDEPKWDATKGCIV